ncbi:hypothetical protein BX070DRAFT_228706 [Coemansia spiralis]|nr:hypothetical protein BX070DRAFT_228706 [Coemansia spiralis]
METHNRIITHVRRLLLGLQLADKRLLLAVSGGADSMALAYIVSRAIGATNCYAVTVDHGFRPESAQEAKDVGRFMKQLGITHEIKQLRWEATGTQSLDKENILLPPLQRLEEVARERRYYELNTVCRTHRLHAVLTGHHAGDQAETFLLRFLRQSGVYGMAGMPIQAALPFSSTSTNPIAHSWPKPVLVRPLLTFSKQLLYDLCSSKRIQWYEDSSNIDTRFKRNQLRQLINSRSDDSGGNFPIQPGMQQHRNFINKKVTEYLATCATLNTSAGTIELIAGAEPDKQNNKELPCWASNSALRERILANVVEWIASNKHSPELFHLQQFEKTIVNYYSTQKLESACNKNNATKPVTAAGVSMYPPTTKHGWLFCRQRPRAGEIKACERALVGESAIWDQRLLISVWSKNNLNSLPSGTTATWSAYALVDSAAHQWMSEIDKHRRYLRKARKHLEPYTVQAAQPVVVVQLVKDGGATTIMPPRPIFALGHAIENSLKATDIVVDVCMVRDTADPGAYEIVAAP